MLETSGPELLCAVSPLTLHIPLPTSPPTAEESQTRGWADPEDHGAGRSIN